MAKLSNSLTNSPTIRLLTLPISDCICLQIRAPIYALLAKFALESGSQGQGQGSDHDHLGMATSYALRISERKGTGSAPAQGLGAGADVGTTPSSGARSLSDMDQQGDDNDGDDDQHPRHTTSRDARQDLFCLIAKHCVAQGQGLVNSGFGPGPGELLRPDLVLALLDASSSPSPELLAHAIACLALAGMHLQVTD